MLRKILIPIFVIGLTLPGAAQLSVGTDVSLLNNRGGGKHFLTLGQTVELDYHFVKKESGYVSISYYVPGKSKTQHTVASRSDTTRPRSINYETTAAWSFRQVSVGIKHYLSGNFNGETDKSVFITAGVGLLINKIQNTYSKDFETRLYTEQLPQRGAATLVSPTIDLGVGVEVPLSGNIFAYGSGNVHLPLTTMSSSYLTENVRPLPVTINVGLRILFDFTY